MKTIELKAAGRYLHAALYEPACAAGEKYPLVLFLHGMGEWGDDSRKVTDFTPGIDVFTAPEWQEKHPCLPHLMAEKHVLFIHGHHNGNDNANRADEPSAPAKEAEHPVMYPIPNVMSLDK